MNSETNDKFLILLVDDVPANLHVLAAALKSEYRIKTATSGKAALELVAQQDKPDLILLDVMMPGMSGIEVMRELRRDQETRIIPVIFVSADASEQSQLDGLELGADDYLVKPVAAKVLQVRVRSLLDRKYSESKLRIAAHVFESSGEAIIINDKDNCIIEVNSAFTRLTGYALEDVKGKNPKLLSAGRTGKAVYVAMWQSIREHNFWQGELWDRTKDGRVYPKFLTISVVRNAYNDIEFFIGSFTDISERKAAEESIARLAHYDTLTGLFNRFSLQSRLAQAITRAKREKRLLAVLFIDMDRFKSINDTFGHAVGDALLVEVAHRLRESVRESDIAARFGGDEFVAVLTEVENRDAADTVAHKILRSLGTPYQIGEHKLHSSPSIGLAFFPDDAENIDVLMKNADIAMYYAKEHGRNNVRVFSRDMNEEANVRVQMERDLQVAVAKRQFELHYQPQLSARDGGIIGLEALVRWHHPNDGMISPGKFIPLAEDTGLILPISDWVLDEACRQLQVWRNMGFAGFRIAVNMSAQRLRSPSLLANVALTLEKHDLSGADLELEVTESVAMSEPEASIGQLNALRIMGVNLSIDDFGTGYSSLSYLKMLPAHILKLDQSFVRDIETDKNDASICVATITMAHNLGMRVVAEGVETEAQRDFLVGQGCDYLQGYLFSRPLPAAEATAYLQAHIGGKGE